MSILEKIVATKQAEVAERKALYPMLLLERSVYFDAPAVSLKEYVLRADKSGIIAEFKRRSPSHGAINEYASIEKVSIGYMQAGASALSVLTDKIYFGSQHHDLETARNYNFCPILRKEFIIDEYQIIEARAQGADAILLIAAILSKHQINAFTRMAHALGMEVLLEVHEKEELQQMNTEVDLIGVNNRNLKTLETNCAHSIELLRYIPEGMVKVSESGIDSPETAWKLKKAGFEGLLIGEQFMRSAAPEKACADFVKQLNVLAHGD
ncbi:indole-3-glycerol phosphate synthase TrpC [Taibaiella sp. KBW10]|uniref:indole-3-glycerol phosphate synthase TrpC n=1 Tax=Taibaiella sp. KBW10 TaxID=2153357 RepID=UPI000F594B5F|nr:indole-3-glycerol phosphate synthase TrpC [Taibaiella sp. KBW10]RQO29818.1 indole-3-glycerol phosphate synthase TrpC [Taibaiella sp. KBW10]